MIRRPLLPLAVAAFVAIALTTGCEKKLPPPPSGAGAAAAGPTIPPNAGGVPASPGRAVFETQGCLRCHTVGAPEGAAREGKGKNKGPDLAKVGADPAHTRDWLAAYVRDPKSQNPASHMPPFGAKINEDDLGKLTDYLSSLK